jgi:hypothetical protein
MLGFVSMTTDFNRDDYLTVEQVADLWGIRPNSVLKAIHRGRLPAMLPASLTAKTPKEAALMMPHRRCLARLTRLTYPRLGAAVVAR